MRFRYRTIEFGEIDIHLRTLRDTNEYADARGEAADLSIPPASWPLFGVVWDSSCVLAALMVDADMSGRRILEVGCGIGLASMVLNHRGADITATDRHPEAKAFLDHNTDLNGAPRIDFERSDWRDSTDKLGKFDLIIGSDLLYDRAQAEPLSRFVDAHALPTHQMILVDPGRGQAGRYTRHMAALGFSHSKRRAVHDDAHRFGQDIGTRVQIHSFMR